MPTIALPNDIALANLVHSCIAELTESSSGTEKPSVRFGDSKCFISAVWARLTLTYAYALFDLELNNASDFKRWLVGAMRLVDAKGHPLVLLARADLVGAMDRSAVAASEVIDRGASFHFVLDRNASAEEYRRLAR